MCLMFLLPINEIVNKVTKQLHKPVAFLLRNVIIPLSIKIFLCIGWNSLVNLVKSN